MNRIGARMAPAAALVVAAALGGCDPAGDGDNPAGAGPAPPASDLTAPPAIDTEQLRIALTSSAKRLCSSVFVAGRDAAHVQAEELEALASMDVRLAVDEQDLTVLASAGGESAIVLYRPHLGCTVTDADAVDDLRAQFDATAYPAPTPLDPEAPWPLGSAVTLPESVPGLDLTAIDAAVDAAFAEPDPDNPVRTRAVVVVHDGRIVAERYAPPFDAATPQLGWSMTKTVTAALTGMLVADGTLETDAPAPVPEWQAAGDPRRAITLEHLLHMSSGLAFSEIYTPGSASDVILMLYGPGARDMGAFTADKPLAHPPGQHFSYASGTTNLIARIQRQTFEDLQDYFAFPRKRLFAPLGMASAVIEPDVSGTFVGSSYMYATPRDWARFGLLYLQDGVWDGERILPEGWVDYSLTPAPAAERGQYGVQIWLNAGAGEQPPPNPALPAETFYLSGFEGQNVVVVPSERLVVVRLGLTRGEADRPVWTLTRRILDALDGPGE